MQSLSGFCEVFDEYGGWDAAYGGPATPVQLQATNVFPMKIRVPGIDTDENDVFQILEEEVMQPEDYEKICEVGIDAFYKEEYLQRISDLSHEDISNFYNLFINKELNHFEVLFKSGNYSNKIFIDWRKDEYS